MRKRDLKVGHFYNIVSVSNKRRIDEECDYVGTGKLLKIHPKGSDFYGLLRFHLGFETTDLTPSEVISEKKYFVPEKIA